MVSVDVKHHVYLLTASPMVSVDVKHHVYLLTQRPFSPSVPAEAGWLFAVAAGVHVFISGESL